MKQADQSLPDRSGPGRPTDYRPEYCQTVIQMGKEGKTLAQMALALDVSRQTLYGWSKIHADFFDAMARARDYSLAWWEDMGQRGVTMGKDFNAAVWSRSMAARFPEDYREQPVGAADAAAIVQELMKQLGQRLPG